MAHLEEIAVGCNVTGLSGKGAVTIVSVKWHGNSVMEVVFKDSAGQLGEQMLYREGEASLGIQDSGLPWALTPCQSSAAGIGSLPHPPCSSFRHLSGRAYFLRGALPLQISAVYQEMLKRLPRRYILADDWLRLNRKLMEVI